MLHNTLYDIESRIMRVLITLYSTDMKIPRQQAVSAVINSAEALLDYLPAQGPADSISALAHEQFSFKAPRAYLDKIDRHNPDDPLLLQILPSRLEEVITDGYVQDPVGDLDALKVPGLLHKYHGRVLFVVTSACAIHCRYCFRRHYPYGDASLGNTNWEPAFDYIRQHDSIREVILSGGDPLMLGNDKLNRLVSEFSEIPHLKRLRIHSRIPSVLPERIDDTLLAVLAESRFNVSLVTHINHTSEIGADVCEALSKLKAGGVMLLNQSVLLAGVNDSTEVLCDLSEKLYENGVLPYYLHLFDPVQGAAHFDVHVNTAHKIIKTMTESLPGYLVPRLVKENKGDAAKTRIV